MKFYCKLFILFVAVNKHVEGAVAKIHSLCLDGKEAFNEICIVENIYLLNVAYGHSAADFLHI